MLKLSKVFLSNKVYCLGLHKSRVCFLWLFIWRECKIFCQLEHDHSRSYCRVTRLYELLFLFVLRKVNMQCSPVPLFPRFPVSLFPCSPVLLLPCSPVTLFPSESVESFPCSSVNLKFFTQMKRPHSSVNGRGIFTWWISERLINIYFSSPVLSLLNINDGQARGRCPSLRCCCSLLWPFRDRERQKRRLGTTQLPLPRKLQQKGWGKTKKKLSECRGPRKT